MRYTKKELKKRTKENFEDFWENRFVARLPYNKSVASEGRSKYLSLKGIPLSDDYSSLDDMINFMRDKGFVEDIYDYKGVKGRNLKIHSRGGHFNVLGEYHLDNTHKIIYISDRGNSVKGNIIEENKGLVVAAARRFVGHDFNDLISVGNETLNKVVDLYNGSKEFSTYATGSIVKGMTRYSLLERRQKSRFVSVTGDKVAQNKVLELLDEDRQRHVEFPGIDSFDAVNYIFENGDLSEMEERVLKLRFGVGRGEALTLKQTGEVVGLTKERIRQIQLKALGRLKKKFGEEGAWGLGV